MINQALLLAAQYAPLLQAEEEPKFPWWLALLILAIVIIVLIWALTRNASYTETPHVAHGDDKGEPVHIETHAAEADVESAPAEPLPVEEVRAPELIPAPVEVPTPVVPDDLKLIEGIGPKIAEVLNEAGIHTFAQLADTSVADLQAILDRANLRLGDPATWPEQSRLAAKGDLEGLQALQDSLKGGRKE